MTPLVTIITPTYNHEAFIAECIQSVLNQTFSNWEMIVIDDGSSDNTAVVAEKYALQDPRIRLIKQKNIGIFRLSETYNIALAQATGEFVAILEGDDYWEPQKLAVQLEAIQNCPDAVLCWGKAASRVRNQSEIFQIHPVNLATKRRFYDNLPLGAIFNAVFYDFFAPLTFLIRKSTLLKIGGFIQVQPFPAVDLSTLLLLSKIGRFVFIDQVFGTWRIFPQQTTKTRSLEILKGSQKIILNHYRSLTEQEKSALHFDERFIHQHYKKRMVITYARSGRFKLVRKEFRNARRDYLQAIFSFGLTEPMWKLRAFTGLIFSYFHLDVEVLARWFGKGSIK